MNSLTIILLLLAAVCAAGVVWTLWPKGVEFVERGSETVGKVGAMIKKLLGGE